MARTRPYTPTPSRTTNGGASVGDVLGEAVAPGTFGENLTLEGIDVDGLIVGDTWEVGSTRLRVTQPRFPCFKLGIRMGDVGLRRPVRRRTSIRRLLRDRGGRLGRRRRRDRAALSHPDDASLSVADFIAAHEDNDVELLSRIAGDRHVPDDWRRHARARSPPLAWRTGTPARSTRQATAGTALRFSTSSAQTSTVMSMSCSAIGESVRPDRHAIEIVRGSQLGLGGVDRDAVLERIDAQRRHVGHAHPGPHHRRHRAVVVRAEHVVGHDPDLAQPHLARQLARVGVLADRRLLGERLQASRARRGNDPSGRAARADPP